MDVKKKLVMIGNGMAGVRMIEHLLKLAPDAYDVTIFGAEPHPNYNRIMLSSVLAGKAGWKDIVINDWAWYRDNRIRLLAGHTAVRNPQTGLCDGGGDQRSGPGERQDASHVRRGSLKGEFGHG